jgi:hypothetical protein
MASGSLLDLGGARERRGEVTGERVVELLGFG